MIRANGSPTQQYFLPSTPLFFISWQKLPCNVYKGYKFIPHCSVCSLLCIYRAMKPLYIDKWQGMSWKCTFLFKKLLFLNIKNSSILATYSKKCSGVPSWHPLDSWWVESENNKSARKHLLYSSARFTIFWPCDCRTNGGCRCLGAICTWDYHQPPCWLDCCCYVNLILHHTCLVTTIKETRFERG